MRYSIMLQLVTSIALILVAGAALFGWLQSRPTPNQSNVEESSFNLVLEELGTKSH